MKDIKSIVIGFLMATCMFLFMGYTSSGNSEVGRYQMLQSDDITVGGAEIPVIFRLDTKTGDVVWAIHTLKEDITAKRWRDVVRHSEWIKKKIK